MPRKQRTEEEKAQTEYTDFILASAEEEGSIAEDVANILTRLTTRGKLSNQAACCALRDYAQLLVARHMDRMAKGLDEDFLRLKAELEAELKG